MIVVYALTGYVPWCREAAGGPQRSVSTTLVDRSSVEVFTGDGTVLTGRIYPRYEQSTGVDVSAIGGDLRLRGLRIWRMGSAWS